MTLRPAEWLSSSVFSTVFHVIMIYWVIKSNNRICFSRRFMKWNATIIVTLFFNPHELAKIVLRSYTKFYGVKGATWPSELNQKAFSFFSRNIQYRKRLKGPPIQFFSALRDCFSKKKFPKGPPLISFRVLRQNGCWKIPKGPPFHFFRHCGTIFRKKFSLQFFDVLR